MLGLNRRAGHAAVTAEHAAVARFRLEAGAAAGAVPEKQAGILWHSLGAWAVGALESLKVFSNYQRAFGVAGGVVLILSGLYMLNAFFIVIPALAV